MKAITLHQPWASLVAIGAKRIETRSWKTNYRGELAIHASKTSNKNICQSGIEPFFTILKQAGFIEIKNGRLIDYLPRGVIIATCNLFDCREITVRMLTDSKEHIGWYINGYFWKFDYREREFGDFTIGRYAWFLKDVKILSEQIPAKGMLGLWEYGGL